MVKDKNKEIILLSIHPAYANSIFDGSKRVEFRRATILRPVSHVLVYATAPVGLIVGYTNIGSIEYDSPSALWRKYNGMSGMEKAAFRNYFKGAIKATAILLNNPIRLEPPLLITKLSPKAKAPQSFRYVSYSQFRAFVKPPFIRSLGHGL